MRIKDVVCRVRCDMPNCNNEASIKIEKTGFFKFAGMYLCKNCMNELYEELGKRVVPKSIDNMLNKKIQTKRKKSDE